jgi:transcriptional regulator with PAS, ATPase and Fis domain
MTRVGGRRALTVDLRVVAATNADLQALVRKGEFRADLYYRIEVVKITLLPLRERMGDLPALCRHFIGMFNQRHKKKVGDLSSPAYEKLFASAWPGNVRELKNTLERAVIFCDGEVIRPELIAQATSVPGGGTTGRTGPRPLKQVDEETLRKLFREHSGVTRKVARALGVTPRALYDRINKFKLTAEGLRGNQPVTES